jgi:hypothetical protein
MITFFFMVAPDCRSRFVHGTLLVVAVEAAEAGETAGVVGIVVGAVAI